MTYSIIARDDQAGQIGVGVQSRFFGVGRSVPWAQAGVGVVATQAVIDPRYGARGLAGLRAGRDARDVLAALTAEDHGEAARQVAILGVTGEPAVHIGSGCVPTVAHRQTPQLSAQGNMLRSPEVIDALVEAFEAASGDLCARLLAALDAAEAAGGDLRGRQSAALMVVETAHTDAPWDHIVVDVRVDDHPDPLAELRRLADTSASYDRLLELIGTPGLFVGDERPDPDAVASALQILRSGPGLGDGNPDFVFWRAVLLARADRVGEARRCLDQAADVSEGLRLFAHRLAASGFYTRQRAEEIAGSLR